MKDMKEELASVFALTEQKGKREGAKKKPTKELEPCSDKEPFQDHGDNKQTLERQREVERLRELERNRNIKEEQQIQAAEAERRRNTMSQRNHQASNHIRPHLQQQQQQQQPPPFRRNIERDSGFPQRAPFPSSANKPSTTANAWLQGPPAIQTADGVLRAKAPPMVPLPKSQEEEEEMLRLAIEMSIKEQHEQGAFYAATEDCIGEETAVCNDDRHSPVKDQCMSTEWGNKFSRDENEYVQPTQDTDRRQDAFFGGERCKTWDGDAGCDRPTRVKWGDETQQWASSGARPKSKNSRDSRPHSESSATVSSVSNNERFETSGNSWGDKHPQQESESWDVESDSYSRGRSSSATDRNKRSTKTWTNSSSKKSEDLNLKAKPMQRERSESEALSYTISRTGSKPWSNRSSEEYEDRNKSETEHAEKETISLRPPLNQKKDWQEEKSAADSSWCSVTNEKLNELECKNKVKKQEAESRDKTFEYFSDQHNALPPSEKIVVEEVPVVKEPATKMRSRRGALRGASRPFTGRQVTEAKLYNPVNSLFVSDCSTQETSVSNPPLPANLVACVSSASATDATDTGNVDDVIYEMCPVSESTQTVQDVNEDVEPVFLQMDTSPMTNVVNTETKMYNFSIGPSNTQNLPTEPQQPPMDSSIEQAQGSPPNSVPLSDLSVPKMMPMPEVPLQQSQTGIPFLNPMPVGMMPSVPFPQMMNPYWAMQCLQMMYSGMPGSLTPMQTMGPMGPMGSMTPYGAMPTISPLPPFASFNYPQPKMPNMMPMGIPSMFPNMMPNVVTRITENDGKLIPRPPGMDAVFDNSAPTVNQPAAAVYESDGETAPETHEPVVAGEQWRSPSPTLPGAAPYAGDSAELSTNVANYSVVVTTPSDGVLSQALNSDKLSAISVPTTEVPSSTEHFSYPLGASSQQPSLGTSPTSKAARQFSRRSRGCLRARGASRLHNQNSRQNFQEMRSSSPEGRPSQKSTFYEAEDTRAHRTKTSLVECP